MRLSSLALKGCALGYTFYLKLIAKTDDRALVFDLLLVAWDKFPIEHDNREMNRCSASCWTYLMKDFRVSAYGRTRQIQNGIRIFGI
jgi:hypothetical protein